MWKYPSTANAHKVLQHAVPLLNLTSETKEGISHITEDSSPNNSESQYYQGDINTVESTSFTETANKYGGKQAYEQAKSQGKTELTYEQWVQVRTPEFKAWFGNWEKPNKKTSKVVNPRTGEPLVVYHGTGHAPFDTFTMDFMGKNGTADGRGHYFTSDPNFANLYTSENGHVFSVFLNVPTVFSNDKVTLKPTAIKKIIKRIDELNGDETEVGFLSNYDDVAYSGEAAAMRTALEYLLEENSNDVDVINEMININGMDAEQTLQAVSEVLGATGSIINQADGSQHFVVSGSNQIKSAVGNVGTFSKDNPNIYYQLDERTNSDFAKAVDKVADGKSGSGYIKVGTTPTVLKMLGLPDVNVEITGRVLHKVMKGKHNVTPETIKQLPREINNPVAVMKSHTEESGYVVLTELTENVKGTSLPVVVALHIKEVHGGFEVVKIASAYGKNFVGLKKGLENDLLYWHKEKGPQLLKRLALQLRPGLASGHENLVTDNVKTESDLNQYITQNSLRQDNDSPRGAFNPESNTIHLFQKADFSTLAHEMGHAYLETHNKVVMMVAQQRKRLSITETARAPIALWPRFRS
ncbi:hypothetical protein IX83_06980 [Basilea psittacipulmonis DSM 24701]|uniref:Uncharacterized protein n=4 Tax=Basilea TaxID=1472344 RepID=A0A077DE10_9BURK|nr:hypothetical protein IX83_06980 [Basilea psittacipulmonis DSM 24701]